MEYTVSWTIELDADTPEDAARQALEIHRDPDSWATHFVVVDTTGRTHEVDLGYRPDTRNNP
jgi:spore germination protein YaaH